MTNKDKIIILFYGLAGALLARLFGLSGVAILVLFLYITRGD